ncbi:hypothetical protein bcgnr5369_68290 [Bacillus cereus]
MGAVLAEIQDGTFARGWIAEHKAGRPNFHATNEKENEHEIEVLKKDDLVKTRSSSYLYFLIFRENHFKASAISPFALY